LADKNGYLRPKRKLFGTLYENICRAYAHRLGDNKADRLYSFLCSFKFIKEHGYIPRFRNPRTFSEKIWHRMLFDRNPIWTELSDKLAARRIVERKVGPNYLIPILWIGDRADDIPVESLPDKFIIKTNHGCGYNLIVHDKSNFELKKELIKINNWLKQNFAYSAFLGMAWAYKNILPKVFVETLIEDNGRPPRDYKFFCFSGRAEYLQITFDRFGDIKERILDRNFNITDIYNGVKLYDGSIEKPINYEKMLELADILSSGFDFIRIDLYNVQGRIYFGEFTCYPAAGLARFVPRRWDFIWGQAWKMIR